MGKQIVALARLPLVKFVAVAMFLCGLVGIVPYVAHPQGQNELTDAPQTVGVTSSTKNPLQIALLHWYDANQTTAFTVGTGALTMAFDGANIWVTNWGVMGSGNTVTKLQASSGAKLGTFACGSGPFGVAFDGANIWVVNWPSNSVTKLRASDGTTLGTFAV